ncbi:uncharacterized protein J3D65DRAFT_634447 [Phyllosticta citribraziliensis]|uniref:Uncharacterized protein n=1 Tax=Phyllosticta citribraziliensis TaxID=989973 RepID=A0ABR1LGW2_9PEZI
MLCFHLQLPSLASHLTFHRPPLGSSVRHLHVALVLFSCYLHRHISNCSATMDYAPAEQHGNAEPHSAFSFTWVIITWDIIVIAPMVLLWYFGFLTLEGDVSRTMEATRLHIHLNRNTIPSRLTTRHLDPQLTRQLPGRPPHRPRPTTLPPRAPDAGRARAADRPSPSPTPHAAIRTGRLRGRDD